MYYFVAIFFRPFVFTFILLIPDNWYTCYVHEDVGLCVQIQVL
jgi:hypothetical protein